jgi:hypothetical protein
VPACTVFYRFPYAIGSDRPCDIDDTLCEFANDVETELDRLDDLVDRVDDSVPMAQIRLTISTLYPSNPSGATPSTIAFDTVDWDTADMVNLTADPYTITLPMGGRYMVYAMATGSSVGAGNIVTLAGSGVTGTVLFDQWLDDASTPIYLNSGAELRYAPAGVVVVKDTFNPALTITVSCPAVGPTLTAVTFGAYWIGDLP